MDNDNYNNCHKELIECGLIKINIVLPFLVSFLFLGRRFAVLIICTDKTMFNCTVDNYCLTLIMFLGESFNIVFVIISLLLRPKPKRNPIPPEQKSSKSFFLIPSSAKLSKPKLWHQLLIVLLTSLIYVITATASHYFLYSGYLYEKDKASELAIELRLFNLFFISLFSFIILSLPIKRHKFFGCSLVGVIIVLFVVMELVRKTSVISIVIFILIYFVLSIREVLHKYLMEVKLMSSVLLISLEGAFGFIMTIIFFLIIQYDFIKALSNIFLDSNTLGFYVLYFLLCFLYDFLAIITKYYFEPTVMSVAYSFSVIGWKLILLSTKKVDAYIELMIFIIGGIFALFGCLVYNEIIILKFCKLERDTKKEIIRRSEIDSFNSLFPI